MIAQDLCLPPNICLPPKSTAFPSGLENIGHFPFFLLEFPEGAYTEDVTVHIFVLMVFFPNRT